MATDHATSDAHHAIRQEISITLEAYKRRVYKDAKAIADQRLTEATNNEEAVHGTEVGRVAANQALTAWGIGEAKAPIDATKTSTQLEPGEAERSEGQNTPAAQAAPDWQP